MDTRRFFILWMMLSEGEKSQRQLMEKLWIMDEGNRNSRKDPWAWYYNMTKCFDPMRRAGLIKDVGKTDDGKLLFDITEEGTEAFIKAIDEEEIFRDPLFRRRKKAIASLIG